MSEQGRKYDGGKLRYDLVPTLALEEVVKVITKGAEKYDDDNWKNVPEGRRRYYAASMRHTQEWKKGNPYDEEMGTHHIANAISNLMFILEKELQGWEDVPEVVEDISEQECVDYHQKLWKESTALNERFIQDGDGYINTQNGEWYPDCSGDWVETDGLDFKTTTAGLCETYIEVLSSYEREDKRYRKAVNTTEYWFCGHSSWGNRVAYKIVKG